MRERLVTPRDVAWMLVLTALALAPRLYWASGIGLSDDFILRGEVNAVLNKQILPDNQAYRFSWWFPAALSCRIFGLTELGLILPFTVTATLAVGLLYLFGKTLWGRPGGIIAALLLAAYPLDFAWSTMVTTDTLLKATRTNRPSGSAHVARRRAQQTRSRCCRRGSDRADFADRLHC